MYAGRLYEKMKDKIQTCDMRLSFSEDDGTKNPTKSTIDIVC